MRRCLIDWGTSVRSFFAGLALMAALVLPRQGMAGPCSMSPEWEDPAWVTDQLERTRKGLQERPGDRQLLLARGVFTALDARFEADPAKHDAMLKEALAALDEHLAVIPKSDARDILRLRLRIRVELAARLPEAGRAAALAEARKELAAEVAEADALWRSGAPEPAQAALPDRFWPCFLYDVSRAAAPPAAATLLRELRRALPEHAPDSSGPAASEADAAAALGTGFNLLACALATEARPELGTVFPPEEKNALLRRARAFFARVPRNRDQSRYADSRKRWEIAELGRSLAAVALAVPVDETLPAPEDQNALLGEALETLLRLGSESGAFAGYGAGGEDDGSWLRLADDVFRNRSKAEPARLVACRALLLPLVDGKGKRIPRFGESGERERERLLRMDELWRQALARAPDDGLLWLSRARWQEGQEYGSPLRSRQKNPESVAYAKAACLIRDDALAWWLWDLSLRNVDPAFLVETREYLAASGERCPAFAAFAEARLQLVDTKDHKVAGNAATKLAPLFVEAAGQPHPADADLLIWGYQAEALNRAVPDKERTREDHHRMLALLLKSRALWNELQALGDAEKKAETPSGGVRTPRRELAGAIADYKQFPWWFLQQSAVYALLKERDEPLNDELLLLVRTSVEGLMHRTSPPPLQSDTELARLLRDEARWSKDREVGLRLIDRAMRIYARAAEDPSPSLSLLRNWADALTLKSDKFAENDAEKLALLRDALEKTAAALEAEPDNQSLHRQAVEVKLRVCALAPAREPENGGQDLLGESRAHFALATGLPPESKTLLDAWAGVLRQYAEKGNGPGSAALLKEADAADAALFAAPPPASRKKH